MGSNEDKKILDKEINRLNEEINILAYKLSGILDVDCSFGVCTFDPQVDNIQDKIKEVQEKKGLLERLKANIDSYLSK
ncbi:hypothetical protein JXL19_09365 [bacterium]|nr:hypothetical protein [bacterium]